MREMLIALAEYNQAANKKVIEILKQADPALLREDQGAFYKSVLGTFEHVAAAEIMWLKRFAGYFTYASLSGQRLIDQDIDTTKAAIKDKSEGLYAAIAEADALFLAFVKEVRAEELTRRMTYTTMKGDKLERLYLHMIVHILNHGTHHRGEISALLDRKGIANDYSSFNAYMK